MYGSNNWTMNTEEYDRRCNENVAACVAIGGPLSDDDLMQIGVMVARMMKQEWLMKNSVDNHS